MLRFEKAREIIEQELKNLSIPKEPSNLYLPVKYALANGGKRLRPTLVLLACDLFGADFRKALYPALGLEIFHNFTLLHDDLMDNSPFRRNKATVHVKWDPNTAILSGDAMSIFAYSLICAVDPAVLAEVVGLFNKTALQVCEGQMLDMDYSLKKKLTIPEYLEMIGLKTSVLIAASLGIGAIIAGAEKKSSAKIYDFGMNLGLAFQLMDDLLDSFGDQQVFGKKIGNDILTNKKTFLLIKAMERAKGNELERLVELYSGNDFDPEEKINAVIHIFQKLDIRKATELKISEYHMLALSCLEEIDLPSERKCVLRDFSETLMKRDT